MRMVVKRVAFRVQGFRGVQLGVRCGRKYLQGVFVCFRMYNSSQSQSAFIVVRFQAMQVERVSGAYWVGDIRKLGFGVIGWILVGRRVLQVRGKRRFQKVVERSFQEIKRRGDQYGWDGGFRFQEICVRLIGIINGKEARF